MRGKFHFVRRAIKPAWLDRMVTRRFNRAGFGVFPKRGSLDAMLAQLEQGDAIVFPFDQHAGPPDGIEAEFFGHPAWTFKSLAIIALATGAPVLPAASWREADGRHVLRFEEPMAPIECENTSEAIRRNTRAYNAVLERLIVAHPEQWWWVHRRWKHAEARKRARRQHRGDIRPAQRAGLIVAGRLFRTPTPTDPMLESLLAPKWIVLVRLRRLGGLRALPRPGPASLLPPADRPLVGDRAVQRADVRVLGGAEQAVHRRRRVPRARPAARALAGRSATRDSPCSKAATSAPPPSTTTSASIRCSAAATRGST